MAETKKNPNFTTPKGIAVWPRLNEPDTKFDAKGVYSVKLQLSAADSADLRERIDTMAESALKNAQKQEDEKAKEKKAKPKQAKEADKPYTENEDGSFNFNFKLKATWESKRLNKSGSQRPSLFDAKMQKIDPAKVKIGGGSTIRVNYEMSEFYVPAVGAGVSLRLRAVQVLDLQQWSGGDAASYGFEAEEGFEGTEAGDEFAGAETESGETKKQPSAADEF